MKTKKLKKEIIHFPINKINYPTVLYPIYKIDPIKYSDPIDIVLLWVNKNDKKWYNNYKKYVNNVPDINRYTNFDELELCLASICRYMSWLRRIYIITECDLPDYAKKNDKVFPVHQSTILRKECIQPNFNSNVIESCMHRIPDLSEIFLFGCDDFMVGKSVSKKEWFYNNLPKCELRLKQLPEIKSFWYYLYNAIKISGDYFGIYPGIGKKTVVPTHQFSILRKKTCYYTWKLFYKELSIMGKSRIRLPYESQITYHLLAQIVGGFTGTLHIKIDRYNKKSLWVKNTKNSLFDSNIYMGNNIKTEQEIDWLKNIENNTPKFYCINKISTQTENYFKIFKINMLKKINNK